ncbi:MULTISPECIES: flagellar biosynthesis anti-sigma factor FlgM [Bacillus]|uniref:Negative regulator of flagellin synthesis n=2 Tax=Bacillus TaxID=1386 RepID=A0A0M5JEV4_9BACI|nr:MULTISPECIES: flagellar biosynthesis anti-sigma factor FlgM [Bacillus]ALC82501.1 flagellar biosynthesis protein FlgM [Bacillus gobiensis]MBP1081397.1 negative regulator of flagellin synthesis FlgM [Bacillus capparidis]MED1096069.1 flagellar biosynthesis anti-sigma factor FlgM [Bacillus capparidis]
MKINRMSTQPINPYLKTYEKQNTQPAKSPKQDKLEISKQAKELQKAPEVNMERQEKLAELKRKIDSGTYEIDAKGIAEKLVNFYKNK